MGMTRRQKKWPMHGCSRKRKLGGGTGSYNQDPVYMYKGPRGPFPGWINSSMQRGGSRRRQKGGNNGLPYGKFLAPMKAPIVPNGHTGSTWRPNFKWPGTDLVQGNYNYFPLNRYINDVSRAMKDIGAGFPFLKGGGSRRRRRKQRGGLSVNNTLVSDIRNGIRGAGYGNETFFRDLAGSSKIIQNPDPTVQNQLLKK